MMRTLILLVLISLLSACSNQQQGAAQHVLVAAGSTSQHPAVSPTSLNRMVTAAQDQFNQQGHKAFDIAAVSGVSRYQQGELARHQLVDLANSASRPALDVLLHLQASVNVLGSGYQRKLIASVDGTMLRVGSGKMLGSRSSSRELSIAPSCQQDCLQQQVAELLRQLAQDLSAVLAQQLGSARSSGQVGATNSGYNLTFNNFSAAQLASIEQALTTLSGYRSHRPGYIGHTRAEYWYQTRLGSAALNRDVQLILKQLGLRATQQFSGNSLVVEHISLRPATPSTDYQW